MDSTKSPDPGRPQLQMRWVQVRDDKGRAHMESVWVDASRMSANDLTAGALTSGALTSGALTASATPAA